MWRVDKARLWITHLLIQTSFVHTGDRHFWDQSHCYFSMKYWWHKLKLVHTFMQVCANFRKNSSWCNCLRRYMRRVRIIYLREIEKWFGTHLLLWITFLHGFFHNLTNSFWIKLIPPNRSPTSFMVCIAKLKPHCSYFLLARCI